MKLSAPRMASLKFCSLASKYAIFNFSSQLFYNINFPVTILAMFLVMMFAHSCSFSLEKEIVLIEK